MVDVLAERGGGRRCRRQPTFGDDAAVTVVCAAEGYPVAPRTGDVIEGLEAAAAVPGVEVYCAGVAADAAGRLVTAGGRVLDVTAVGPDGGGRPRPGLRGRRRDHWPGLQVRTDIAAAV